VSREQKRAGSQSEVKRKGRGDLVRAGEGESLPASSKKESQGAARQKKTTSLPRNGEKGMPCSEHLRRSKGQKAVAERKRGGPQIRRAGRGSSSQWGSSQERGEPLEAASLRGSKEKMSRGGKRRSRGRPGRKKSFHDWPLFRKLNCVV